MMEWGNSDNRKNHQVCYDISSRGQIRSPFHYRTKMVVLRNTLIEVGWPQPPSPIQTNNTTAACVVNGTIVSKKLKSVDLRLRWLRCCEVQKQFRFYWDKGPNNWGDYSTNHHPPVYHLTHQPLFAGAAFALY